MLFATFNLPPLVSPEQNGLVRSLLIFLVAVLLFKKRATHQRHLFYSQFFAIKHTFL